MLSVHTEYATYLAIYSLAPLSFFPSKPPQQLGKGKNSASRSILWHLRNWFSCSRIVFGVQARTMNRKLFRER
jgi:hypothetical protein